jgi:pyruvate dehydrogenase E1 component alpha subunit
MNEDIWFLYRQMLLCRRYEEAVIDLWEEGKIPGEMHLGIGEEAIHAGIVSHLRDGDAMALDHRGTPPLLVRGVDPVSLLREFLGDSRGLCAGKGGHMHLFSQQHLAASSGIVGAAGPTAMGFALSNQMLRPGSVALAFFGDGAMNQGMLMESMNLTAAWNLPVLFICKDNCWAITTRSSSVTGGSLVERAASFGLDTVEIDGADVEAVHAEAGKAIEQLRGGGKPVFLHLSCVRLSGHFLGDPMQRIGDHPIREAKKMAGPLLKSTASLKGAPAGERAGSLLTAAGLIKKALKDKRWKQRDPLTLVEEKLKSHKDRLKQVKEEIDREIKETVEAALAPA